MSQLYAVGPVEVWVDFPFDPGPPQFLGFGERAPVIEVTRSYVPHKVDSGGQPPVEAFYAGKSGRVSVDLVRFDMLVLDAVRDVARTATKEVTGRAVDPGLDDAGAIGTPMVLSGAAYKLYLRFPYANKTAFQSPVNGALPAGYRFLAAMLDPEVVRPGGTSSHYKTHLVWNCVRKLIPGQLPPQQGFTLGTPTAYSGPTPPTGPAPQKPQATLSAWQTPGGRGGWRLFDYDMTDLVGYPAD